MAQAQSFHPTIIQRLTNVAVRHGPFGSPWENTQPGAGLRQAARMIGMIIGALLAFLGVIFLVLMIRAGIRWMLARGNESEIEGAKATIRSAIFGLLIVALSYAFVSLVGALVLNTRLLRG